MTTTLDPAAPVDPPEETPDSAPSAASSAVMQEIPKGIFRARGEQLVLAAFTILPLVAVVAVPVVVWGSWFHWWDLVIGGAMYWFTGHGITVGYHRFVTHGSFKAKRWVKVMLAVAGSMAVEGPVKRWVADHRRHHAFSDQDGDPHSPHRFGAGLWPMTKGLVHAHIGWLFDVEQTNQARFIPDLLRDKDIRIVDKLFAPLAALSLGLPALFGWIAAGFTWQGALEGFFWAGLIRMTLLHHVTWSVNSICHTIGRTPFKTRDRSRNVWPLAILSMGESWHNLHHADPTAARHGVLRGQIDTSARVIRTMEQLHLAWDVRWPSAERIASRRVAPQI
jgi:stearoyl-CoA desaturase (Delta-9 desaturase)